MGTYGSKNSSPTHSPEFVHSSSSAHAIAVLPVQQTASQRCFDVQSLSLASAVTVLSCKMQPTAAVHEPESLIVAISAKFWPSSVKPQNDAVRDGLKHSVEQLAGSDNVEQSNQLHFSKPEQSVSSGAISVYENWLD